MRVKRLVTAKWPIFRRIVVVYRISESAMLTVAMGVVGGILGLLGLRILLPNLFSSKTTHAENLIIALKKRELRKQGFNTFWNTRNYNKLRRR